MPVKPLSKRGRTSKTTNTEGLNHGRTARSGPDPDSPVIIDVQGLTMDNESFVPDTDTDRDREDMGNYLSQGEEERHSEQLHPLNTTATTHNTEDDKDETTSGKQADRDNEDEITELRDENENKDKVKTHLKDEKTNTVNDEPGFDGLSDKGGAGEPAKTAADAVKDKQNGATDIKKEEDIVVTVAGKDDVDAASTYSLFMEKDFRYYFQHPYCRMFVSYFVVFCNFLIYAEDPVAHSRKECYIPMIGNDIAMVMTRYPPNAWSLLKVVFWLIGILIGMLVGKLLIHAFLFNKLFRLKMFTDDQGSWMIMFLVSLICVFIMSCFYNLFLMIGGEATEAWRISDLMGVSNDIFMKVAACGTWCGDFFTAWMVTDIMLQEKLYPGWARPVRTWWKKGLNRIILFWIVVVITSFIVVFVIATDYINWDKLNRDFMPTNELSRALLASFILVMDLLIVMQDWDFPHFMSNIDIKLPGMNTAHIRFDIPSCLRKDHWKVHITGKWFNYGVLFLVMLLDLNMWKNQIFYSPYDYGQYTGPEDRIYTVQDHYSLDNFNESQTTYAFRSVSIDNSTNQTYIAGDTHMNTKYFNFSLSLKALAFFPCIIAFIVFGVFIWMFGRFKPTEYDPYAGRLKKRIKKRLSFRLPWRRRAEVKRKVHAVPKLLYFKKKKGQEKEAESEGETKEMPSEGFSANEDDRPMEIPSVSANTETS